MRSTADLFLDVAERNALRRQAGLPLLNIRQEIEKERQRDQAREFNEAIEQRRDTVLKIMAQVLDELRIRHDDPDFGNSFGGRLLVASHAGPRIETYLASLGYVRPTEGGIKYGEMARAKPSGPS